MNIHVVNRTVSSYISAVTLKCCSAHSLITHSFPFHLYLLPVYWWTLASKGTKSLIFLVFLIYLEACYNSVMFYITEFISYFFCIELLWRHFSKVNVTRQWSDVYGEILSVINFEIHLRFLDRSLLFIFFFIENMKHNNNNSDDLAGIQWSPFSYKSFPDFLAVRLGDEQIFVIFSSAN